MIPTPVEFWTLNNTRVGAVAGLELVPQSVGDFYVDGKINQGWDFGYNAGRNLRLADPVSGGITPLAPFTYSVWFKRNDNTAKWADVFCWMDSDSFRFGLADLHFGSTRTLYAFWNAGVGLSMPVPIDTDWHCFVMRYDGSTLSAFVDETKQSAPVAMPTGSLVLFGGGLWQPINGICDSLGYWNVALSDAEIAEIRNSGAGWEYVSSDNTPDVFDFIDVADADLSAVYVSDSQTITGMNAGTAISASGGEYRLDGGAWTSVAGTINPGQTLELRATSSSEPETPVTVSVTVGTATANWTVATKVGATLKQHLIIGPDGQIQPVGACVVVPGWV